MIFKIGRRVGFDELAPIPHFERQDMKRKKTFKSFWMTNDENFETVKAIETETAIKKAEKDHDDKVAKEAVANNKKIRRQKKKGVKKPPAIKRIKSKPKL